MSEGNPKLPQLYDPEVTPHCEWRDLLNRLIVHYTTSEDFKETNTHDAEAIMLRHLQRSAAVYSKAFEKISKE